MDACDQVGGESPPKKDKSPSVYAYAIRYSHRHGTDVWIEHTAGNMPTEDSVIEKLGEDWEGDHREDEYIEIYGPDPALSSMSKSDAMRDIGAPLIESILSNAPSYARWMLKKSIKRSVESALEAVFFPSFGKKINTP